MIKTIIFYMLCAFSVNSFAAVDYFYIKDTGGEKVKVKIRDLETLSSKSVKTETIYTGEEIFTGVLIKEIFKKYKIKGNYVRAFAWDDYSYSVSVDELEKCDVILAYKQSGEYMKIENHGPFAIIYPKGVCPELNTLDINAKTVMQVKLLEVRENE